MIAITRCKAGTIIAAVAGMICATGLSGCSDTKAKPKQEPAKSTDSQKQTAQTQSPTQSQPPAQPEQRTVQAQPKQSQTPVVTTSTPPVQHSIEPEKPVAQATQQPPVDMPVMATEGEVDQRESTSDMIYALIRIRMETMLEKRRQLLASGRSASDVEVRELEGSIMRARGFLTESGEVVEDVDPPILQSTPR